MKLQTPVVHEDGQGPWEQGGPRWEPRFPILATKNIAKMGNGASEFMS